MTTAIQSTYVPFTCTNLTRTQTIPTGSFSHNIPMVLTYQQNFSREYILTCTISAPTQASRITLYYTLGSSSNIALTRVGNTYTISSKYLTTTGVNVNNWPLYYLALKNISYIFTPNISESFTMTTSITDGTTILSGLHTITVA
jgi:hypothetical protein